MKKMTSTNEKNVGHVWRKYKNKNPICAFSYSADWLFIWINSEVTCEVISYFPLVIKYHFIFLLFFLYLFIYILFFISV